MRYVPNLISEAYRPALKDLPRNLPRHTFPLLPVTILLVIIGLFLLVGIFAAKDRTAGKPALSPAQNAAAMADSLKEVQRKDSLAAYLSKADTAMAKKKWKAAKIEYGRALCFAASADSAAIKGKMELCRKRPGKISRKKQGPEYRYAI